MKKILSIALSIVSCILLMQACSSKDDFSVIERPLASAQSAVTSGYLGDDIDTRAASGTEAASLNTSNKIRLILNNNLKQQGFKDIEGYSLKSISRNGRELLHVANFKNGGWVIISGRDQEEDPILAYSTNGQFDPNNVKSPEVAFWLEMVSSYIENAMIDDEAINFMNAERLDDQANALNLNPFPNDELVWVRLPLGTHTTSEVNDSIAPLLYTEWGQGSPWNYKCPYDNGIKCPLGCFAVAFSQLLHYYHFNLGKPDGLYHQIDTCFTWNGQHYTSNVTRSDYYSPSGRWFMMATEDPKHSNLTNIVRYVGDLMIDVGDRLGTTYSASRSTASILSYSVFNQYGLDCSYSDSFFNDYGSNKS